jgi:hypothetical protein
MKPNELLVKVPGSFLTGYEDFYYRDGQLTLNNYQKNFKLQKLFDVNN